MYASTFLPILSSNNHGFLNAHRIFWYFVHMILPFPLDFIKVKPEILRVF